MRFWDKYKQTIKYAAACAAVVAALVTADHINQQTPAKEDVNLGETSNSGETANSGEAVNSEETALSKETENSQYSSAKNGGSEAAPSESDKEETKVPTFTEADMVDFDRDNAFEYCSNPVCTVDNEGESLNFSMRLAGGIPRSDDEKIYLFEAAAFDDEVIDEDEKPVAEGYKDKKVNITFDFKDRYLFERFIPALLYEGEYIPIATGRYISNVEVLAKNDREYLHIESKKGLLIDASTIGDEKLENLNVRRAVFNIPLSFITGETEDPQYPTIEYEYEGETYYFNGYRCMLYDSLFGYFAENGYHSTAIVLNDWNTVYPEIVHPKARSRTGRSLYYAFNTEERDGVRLIEATAKFLAERYSGGDHGMVYDWVIANEINQQRIWNYMDTDDVDYYTESFEKAFRIFYNAIRSTYGSANVYFSVDHDWNDNNGYNRAFFNGRDIVYSFNEHARRGGNYDWSLSIHPYPAPLTRVRFWQGYFDKTENARTVTPMNMSAVTEVLTKKEFLNSKGKVRDIAVTELGFSSRSSEKSQAAAFAYAYYIIEDNEYISSFLLNRQTDDSDSLKSGLALGLYNNDYSEKYITEVFRNIDTEAGKDYIEEMLSVIGEESLEKALERAR